MFEEDESDEFLFCKPALQNLAKLPRKFDWSLSKLILPEVDLFKPGKLNTPVIRAFSFVKQPVDYLLCGKEISFSRAIWLHFPISIRSHSTPCGPQSPILWNLSLVFLWREAKKNFLHDFVLNIYRTAKVRRNDFLDFLNITLQTKQQFTNAQISSITYHFYFLLLQLTP